MKVGILLLSAFLFSCATAPTTMEAKLYEVRKEGLQPIPEPKVEKPKEEELYKKEVLEKLRSMLKEEPTPLAVPPTILRVFVLPYTTEKGELITQHYLYIKVDEGRWIMGDYLLKKGEPIKEFKPLENEGK